jgi:hypothetical protein
MRLPAAALLQRSSSLWRSPATRCKSSTPTLPLRCNNGTASCRRTARLVASAPNRILSTNTRRGSTGIIRPIIARKFTTTPEELQTLDGAIPVLLVALDHLGTA